MSLSITLANIHMVERSATVKGAGGLPGWTKSPGAALRAVTRPVIGLATTSVEFDLAQGDNAIDFGFRLAENCDGIARGQQGAFGGLLVGSRLIDILLRGGFGGEESLLTVQSPGRQLQDAIRGDQCGLRLQQVGTVDGKERLILFYFVAELGEQPDNAPLVIREDLERHVFIVIDTPHRALLDRKQMFAGGLDLDRTDLLLGEVHGVGGSRFLSTLADAGSPSSFGWPPISPVKYAAAARIIAPTPTATPTRPTTLTRLVLFLIS